MTRTKTEHSFSHHSFLKGLHLMRRDSDNASASRLPAPSLRCPPFLSLAIGVTKPCLFMLPKMGAGRIERETTKDRGFANVSWSPSAFQKQQIIF